MRRLRHGMLSLALHELRAGGDGPSLLLLHALGESRRAWRDDVTAWPGAIFALDFAGHGESDWRPGGTYSPELLAADADTALQAVGACAIAGAGLGAYVALLIAGARPDLVPAALLLPGSGLEGSGALPDYVRGRDLMGELDAIDRAATQGATWDPTARSCEKDPRPPVYAAAFGAAARHLVLAEDERPRPSWWERLRTLPNVRRVSPDTSRALASLRAALER